jgi:hypothetical protein
MLQQVRDQDGERELESGDAVAPAQAGRPEDAEHLLLGAWIARTGGVRVLEHRVSRAE